MATAANEPAYEYSVNSRKDTRQELSSDSEEEHLFPLMQPQAQDIEARRSRKRNRIDFEASECISLDYLCLSLVKTFLFQHQRPTKFKSEKGFLAFKWCSSTWSFRAATCIDKKRRGEVNNKSKADFSAPTLQFFSSYLNDDVNRVLCNKLNCFALSARLVYMKLLAHSIILFNSVP